IGDEANLSPSWGWNHPDVTTVIPESACNRDVARRFHLAECVDQALILAFLECLHQHLSVRPSRVIINVQREAEFRSELCACAHGSSLNRFWLVRGQRESASHNHQTRNQQTAKGKLATSWSRVLDLPHSLPPSST